MFYHNWDKAKFEVVGGIHLQYLFSNADTLWKMFRLGKIHRDTTSGNNTLTRKLSPRLFTGIGLW